MDTVYQQRFSVAYSFPVIFTRDAFAVENDAVLSCLQGSGTGKRRALVVIDSGVAAAHPGLPEQVRRYAAMHQERIELVCPPQILRGGEACKNGMDEVKKLHRLIAEHGLCRHSFIIAVGGGALLDAVGFAAATAHRGVRLLRMPTTTLSQNDAGVGVKNAVNAYGRKNFLGSFVPPAGVVADFAFLETLSARELRCGISEAVKVALIRDRAFFDLLSADQERLAAFEPAAMERMIVHAARLHMDHIRTGGDPFESGSARPLDFGHWIAHKLEEVTGGEVRHGEAVAIGIALDSIYSCHQGLLPPHDLERILRLLEQVGFQLFHPAVDDIDLRLSLREFREHLGGALSIPLLRGIGDSIEISHVDLHVYMDCIAAIVKRTGKRASSHDTSIPPVGTRNSGYLFH